MKKILIVSGITIALLVGGTFGIFKVLNNKEQKVEKEEISVDKTKKLTNIAEKDSKEKPIEEVTEINDVEYPLLIDDSSNQDAVIDVMHKIVHQKVKSEDKLGALPMVPNTINQVYDIVSTSNFDRKGELLEIVDRWKKGDFSKVVDDHNYFWSYQGRGKGKAYKPFTFEEEKEFIKSTFREPVYKQMLGL